MGIGVFMEYVAVIIFAALIFGVCFLVDKGFTKLFRNRQQHHSGTAVRLSKHYGSIGLIIAIIGLSAIFAAQGWPLAAGGGVLILVGGGLVAYYMTYGIFYDEQSFLVTGFGKRSRTYRYGDIVGQLLYNSYGHIVVELHMNDGKTVQLQIEMKGAEAFLDKAFTAWCQQTGRQVQDCPFHQPENSCWFPSMEEL